MTDTKLQIEEGAYYLSRDGRVFGPMKKMSETAEYKWSCGFDFSWRDDGSYLHTVVHGRDLIERVGLVRVSDSTEIDEQPQPEQPKVGLTLRDLNRACQVASSMWSLNRMERKLGEADEFAVLNIGISGRPELSFSIHTELIERCLSALYKELALELDAYGIEYKGDEGVDAEG